MTRHLLAAALLTTAPPTLSAAHLWVEAETGRTQNVQRNSWYLDVREGDLSGGGWVASYGGGANPTASYSLAVPAAGRYRLWVRANPISAVLHARFGADGEWKEVPISSRNHDSTNIASDGKPDMRFLAWTDAGAFDLPAGDASLTFRMSSPNGRHGALDCFCLTTDAAWKPQKTQKPGEATGWPAPEITGANLQEWSAFLFPSEEDLAWRAVRWHRHLDSAAAEAEALGRPILLWAMNGHPCGET